MEAVAFLLAALSFLLGSCLGDSSHSLRYFYTSVSEPGQQVPQFFAVGYVDDQQIVYYDPKTRRRRPKALWITKVDKDDPQYWERNTQYVRNHEELFRVNLATALKYYNQSGGFHTVQRMYGCELRKDGSKGGYYQDAYDGRDYISFDKETLTWTALDGPAQITKRKWEAEPAIAQRNKAYLEEECIEWLQKYLEYGKEALLRTASNLGLIIACVVGAVFLVAGIVGIAMYIKKRGDGYKAPSASDEGSNSSGRGSTAPI